jgi:hypothetical protein
LTTPSAARLGAPVPDDGLRCITDMSWGRVTHPSMLNVGDEVRVVLEFDPATERVGWGLEQTQEDPSAIVPGGRPHHRQGHEGHRLRRVRRDRAGHRW